MLELDLPPAPLEGDLLETLDPDLKKNKLPYLAMY
jgi:hypothetical protein